MTLPSSDDDILALARSLDESDPLRAFADEFYVQDPDVCYLDGNSLGRLPKATIDRVNHFLTEEWGTELVDGWSHWIDEAERAGDQLAATVLGTGPGQTLVADTTSMNLYQLCVAAIRARPGRHTIIVDSANFPTDRYIMQGIADLMGLRLITLDTDGSGGPNAVSIEAPFERITAEALAPYLNEDVALLTLQSINYRSGARPPIREINDLAAQFDIPVVWDCSHAVGSIDLDFDGNGVDLAVGCTYKYLNGGPGSPAWLFIRKNWQSALRVPIQGWFAQADQFGMGPWFEKADTIRGVQVASPSIVGIRSVRSSLDMIGRAGIGAIEAKARQGTELMLALADQWLAPLGFSVLTPREPSWRGGHITLGHPEAKLIASALRSVKKVIPDYREPSSIRVAIAPLPTRYSEVVEGFRRLRDLVASGEYRSVVLPESRVT